YAPLEGTVRWPKAIVSQFGNNVPGTEFSLFHVNGIPFGSVICWENIFADHFREFKKRGAQFMVSTTNEAWFGDTAAPHQLLAMTVFRAVENHISIIRAANTGVTAAIDPYGRIISRVRNDGGKEVFIEGVLTAQIPLSSRLTFYTK